MSSTITGVVANGVVVPDSQLPDGAHVEIHVKPVGVDAGPPLTATQLRSMPREYRQAILAAAAVVAEQDYREDKSLTRFDAFSEEEFDDDDSR